MMGLWIALVWLIGVGVSPALAQLYRWTDDTGKVHITDNPETIPPAYRNRARSSTSDAPASDTDADAPAVAPSPSPRPPARAPAPDASARATQRMQALQQQIATARRERQAYLDQLRNERTIHATPEFVRQRRQIGEVGRALLTVEQRLDALQAELERAQQQAQAQQAPATARSTIGIDNTGHDATYWQRRLSVARDRLRQAQAQRRDILTRLATATGSGERVAAGQARLILERAEALYQAAQEIDAAETALQTLQQEALRAGAPAAWLQ